MTPSSTQAVQQVSNTGIGGSDPWDAACNSARHPEGSVILWFQKLDFLDNRSWSFCDVSIM